MSIETDTRPWWVLTLELAAYTVFGVAGVVALVALTYRTPGASWLFWGLSVAGVLIAGVGLPAWLLRE